MKKLSLFLLMLTFSVLFSQFNPRLLEGEWVVNKKEFKDGSRYIPYQQMKNWDKIFVFGRDSYYAKEYITEKKNPYPIKFKITGDKLAFREGHFHKIEKLTDTELIFVDGNNITEENYHVRYYLTRYDFQRKEDLIKNGDKDTLNTTTALSPTPKIDFFSEEFISQGNFPFRAKGYLFFDMKMKTVKAHFTDSKNLSSQDRDRLQNIFSSTFPSWDFKSVAAFKFIKMPFILALYKYSTSNTISYSRIVTGYNEDNYYDITLPDPTQNSQQSLEYLANGIKCFEKKNYECALQMFKRSFEKDKYNFDSHYNYASVSYALGKKSEACNKWAELIQYGQKTAEAKFKESCSK